MHVENYIENRIEKNIIIETTYNKKQIIIFTCEKEHHYN